ncbi:MAG: NAD(+)/NADH kinase [Phycisphaeraceae bacterium]|nr:NAD(+)/NADH kinase [Phycisphaeraceae bacterium]
MSEGKHRPRVLILANRQKPGVVEALRVLRPWLGERAESVGEPNLRDLNQEEGGGGKAPLAHARGSSGEGTYPPAEPGAEDQGRKSEVDLAVVLGGDGTMLAQARHFVDLGVPLLGINFGKLGFLAEFSVEDFQKYWAEIAAGKVPISERLMLEVRLVDTGSDEGWASAELARKAGFVSLVMNDVVITAGPPYRMIELELAIDFSEGVTTGTAFSGDGVIVATPSGSTGYNLAAGGPIVSPGIDALCISPICPYSLAFRPIVAHADATVHLRLRRGNEGTQLVIDGQKSVAMRVGQQVVVTKYGKRVKMLQHPRISYWEMLGQKMKWAVRPGVG